MWIERLNGWKGLLSAVLLAIAPGCGSIPSGIIDDIINGNDNVAEDLVQLDVYATNTNGASGIALDPMTGDLYAVNEDGLFGPIEDGADLTGMTPIGATNLDEAPFEEFLLSSLVLAITDAGEFWIGSPGSGILAVVPPGGGPAEAFEGQSMDNTVQAIFPETMAIVSTGFQGPQIMPGDLLLGQDTDFDALNAIAVGGDRAVTAVDNPTDPDNPQRREAHHLTFGLDGVLYSSRAEIALTMAGIQTIASDGLPTPLAGTMGVKADSFVGLANGDLIIRGARAITAVQSENGILVYSAADEDIVLGLELPLAEISEADEMVITADGDTVFLSLPNRNQIVRAIDLR
jgi:hypothetical protein